MNFLKTEAHTKETEGEWPAAGQEEATAADPTQGVCGTPGRGPRRFWKRRPLVTRLGPPCCPCNVAAVCSGIREVMTANGVYI